MQNSTSFTVEKGMVFWMDVPSKEQPVPLPSETCVQKKRPYVVLSSAEMNTINNLIHVAPITTKPPYESQWFKVPFKKRDSTCCWINISNLMLVPKKYCTPADYSEAHSNVIRGNKELMSRIDEAILKWFDIIHEVSVTEVTQNDEVSAPVQPQSINITINIPGLANVQAVADMDGKVEVNSVTDVAPEEVVEPIVEEVKAHITHKQLKRGRSAENTQFKKYCMKYIKTNSRAFNGDLTDVQIAEDLNISITTVRRYKYKIATTMTTDSKPITKVQNSKPNKILTPKQRQEVIQFIKKHSRAFSGNMTDAEMAKVLGVGHCTITRYKAKISKSNPPKYKTGKNKFFQDELTEKLFMQCYEQFGPTEAYERFKGICGFKSIKTCYDLYYNRKHRKEKVK